MSKYTRKSTRERLLNKLIEREVFVEDEIDKIAQMMYRYDALVLARTSAPPLREKIRTSPSSALGRQRQKLLPRDRKPHCAVNVLSHLHTG